MCPHMDRCADMTFNTHLICPKTENGCRARSQDFFWGLCSDNWSHFALAYPLPPSLNRLCSSRLLQDFVYLCFLLLSKMAGFLRRTPFLPRRVGGGGGGGGQRLASAPDQRHATQCRQTHQSKTRTRLFMGAGKIYSANLAIYISVGFYYDFFPPEQTLSGLVSSYHRHVTPPPAPGQPTQRCRSPVLPSSQVVIMKVRKALGAGHNLMARPGSWVVTKDQPRATTPSPTQPCSKPGLGNGSPIPRVLGPSKFWFFGSPLCLFLQVLLIQPPHHMDRVGIGEVGRGAVQPPSKGCF